MATTNASQTCTLRFLWIPGSLPYLRGLRGSDHGWEIAPTFSRLLLGNADENTRNHIRHDHFRPAWCAGHDPLLTKAADCAAWSHDHYWSRGASFSVRSCRILLIPRDHAALPRSWSRSCLRRPTPHHHGHVVTPRRLEHLCVIARERWPRKKGAHSPETWALTWSWRCPWLSCGISPAISPSPSVKRALTAPDMVRDSIRTFFLRPTAFIVWISRSVTAAGQRVDLHVTSAAAVSRIAQRRS